MYKFSSGPVGRKTKIAIMSYTIVEEIRRDMPEIRPYQLQRIHSIVEKHIGKLIK